MTELWQVPQYTLDDYETKFADRHLIHGVVAKWARERGDQAALTDAAGRRVVAWSEFERETTLMACALLRLGFKKGDFLVTMLPMSVDHVVLEYGCFKIGVIVAPLDLRLTAAEVMKALETLRPRGFAGLGVKGPMDFRPLWSALQTKCPWMEHWLTVDSDLPVEGARSYAEFVDAALRAEIDTAALAGVEINENDGALVIFTTGSTGSPKPALLSHRNITSQNLCLSGAFFGGDSGMRTLVNLPASHVGAQTEILMTTLFGGGSAVLLEIFDAVRTLRAIAEHKVEILGQIPAMFNLEWMLKDYDRHDLSSLKFAAYGGNAVSRPFLEKLATMAPVVGTGLGLTETAGFCTYVLADATHEEKALAGLGVDMPIYPCTIRQPMGEDGRVGEELVEGEIGHVCFRGPQTFVGYVNDAAATARTVSSDGYLYTGDLGKKDGKGLHLTGRDKWVIKSMGYQIYPGDVEAHVCRLVEKVANCVVVGVRHEVLSEAPVAVVELKPGIEVTRQELDRHARELPVYMRPRHWILLEAGKMPLNRVVKPDHMMLQELARAEIVELRSRGEWDSGYGGGEKSE